jgi:hypothetical protein
LIARPIPRKLPSTSRRYRIFSPSFIPETASIFEIAKCNIAIRK